MDSVIDQIQELKSLLRHPRHAALSTLNVAMVLLSALMMWRGLMWWTKSDSPLVVVLSGSMETAMYKGDILLLDNTQTHMNVGEIVIYRVDQKEIPIVHRIIEDRILSDGSEVYLTKGDNNEGDDRVLYARGQQWLSREKMVGRSIGFLPYCGHVTILLNEYQFAKVGLILVMAYFVITSKE